MNGYRFDIMTEAETANGPDKSALHSALLARPFQLFYPSMVDEVNAYVANPKLKDAVNVSLATGRPLLLTGEPGTGKTSAATWIAGRLGLERIHFQVKSNSRAQELLYAFNAIDYFRASQVAASAGQPAPDKGDFVEEGPFWHALRAQEKPNLLLIDEIDKAPRDFPNDLLFELDRMEFTCPEKGGVHIVVKEMGLRPIVVITSNSERKLPEPFLRRCVYHNIVLDQQAFTEIVDQRLKQTIGYFEVDDEFRKAAEQCFFTLRRIDSLQKKPSINEFWQWFVCCVNADSPEPKSQVIAVANGQAALSTLPNISALLKHSEDIARLQ